MIVKDILLLSLLAACIGCNSTPLDTSAQDTAEIKTLEDNFSAAVKNKDVNTLMSFYTPDSNMVVFDVVPPLQYIGADAYRKDWQETFSMFPGPSSIDINNLNITTGTNVAFASSTQHGTFTGRDGKRLEMTVRVTDGYKKVNGHWLIAHEHASIPVDLATMKGDTAAK